MNECVVIDYGVGNLLSVIRALNYLGVSSKITSDPSEVLSAKKIILPGVGAFKNAMQSLDRLQLIEPIKASVSQGTSILGICLGMQLLLNESEEFGNAKGLGLIPGKVLPLSEKIIGFKNIKIPNVGWRSLKTNYFDNGGVGDGEAIGFLESEYFYFSHSFYSQPFDSSTVLASTLYGDFNFPAVIKYKKIFGCQFHPEKSGQNGLNFLNHFCHS